MMMTQRGGDSQSELCVLPKGGTCKRKYNPRERVYGSKIRRERDSVNPGAGRMLSVWDEASPELVRYDGCSLWFRVTLNDNEHITSTSTLWNEDEERTREI